MRNWKCSRFSLPLLLMAVGLSSVNGQLHFASLGNFGSGRKSQQIVADALRQTAEVEKFSFILSPGSNFDGGISSSDDTKFDHRFSAVYGARATSLKSNNTVNVFKPNPLRLPFFTVLGSEDWAGNHTAQILRSKQVYSNIFDARNITAYGDDYDGPKFTLPNYWYHYATHFRDASETNALTSAATSSVALIFIDTFILSTAFPSYNVTRMHWDALRDTLEHAGRAFEWVIVVGDQPLIATGRKHFPLKNSLGQLLHDYGVNAYISGGTRNLEILKEGNLTHIVCGTGGGSSSNSLRAHKDSLYYSSKAGFCAHELTKKGFTTTLVDAHSGAVLFNHTDPLFSRRVSWFNRYGQYSKLPEINYVEIPAFEVGFPAPSDAFVRVIGTLGLAVLAYLALSILVQILLGFLAPNLLQNRYPGKTSKVGGTPPPKRTFDDVHDERFLDNGYQQAGDMLIDDIPEEYPTLNEATGPQTDSVTPDGYPYDTKRYGGRYTDVEPADDVPRRSPAFMA